MSPERESGRKALDDLVILEKLVDPEAIRKQVYDLRPGDLQRFPIWEHALDEEGWPDQDEATVKPRPDLAEADPGEGMFIVRAEFVARDGSRFDGYVYPQLDFSLGFLQPTIVTEQGQVNFWYGSFVPSSDQLGKAYAVLAKAADELFPISFGAVVSTSGARLDGEIPAFLYLSDWESGRDDVAHVT